MRHDDDEVRDAPISVVLAVSLGTVPLPFLFVYAALFTLHGWFAPVHPPDITSSQHGELVAGLIAAAAFVVMTVTLIWFLNRRRRWPFALAELAVACVAIYFLTDSTKGGPLISALVLVATVSALILGFAPSAWDHLDRTPPQLLRQVYGLVPNGSTTEAGTTTGAAGDAARLPQSTEPTLVAPSSLRRRRSFSRR